MPGRSNFWTPKKIKTFKPFSTFNLVIKVENGNLFRRSKVYKWLKILFIFCTKSILNFWSYLYIFLENFWSSVRRQFWTSEIWPYDQSPSLKNVTYLMFQVLNWWLMETGESTNENTVTIVIVIDRDIGFVANEKIVSRKSF